MNLPFVGQLTGPLGFGVALVLVLLLVFVVAFVLRSLTSRRINFGGAAPARNRLPRLGVVDVYNLDTQRKLVLVRRDNVEHLMMIGGPNDVVVETAIVRAAQASMAARGEAAREGGRDLRIDGGEAEDGRMPERRTAARPAAPVRSIDLPPADDEPAPPRPSSVGTPPAPPAALSPPAGSPRPAPARPVAPSRLAARLGEPPGRPPYGSNGGTGEGAAPPRSASSGAAVPAGGEELAKRLEDALRRPGAAPDASTSRPIPPASEASPPRAPVSRFSLRPAVDPAERRPPGEDRPSPAASPGSGPASGSPAPRPSAGMAASPPTGAPPAGGEGGTPTPPAQAPAGPPPPATGAAAGEGAARPTPEARPPVSPPRPTFRPTATRLGAAPLRPADASPAPSEPKAGNSEGTPLPPPPASGAPPAREGGAPSAPADRKPATTLSEGSGAVPSLEELEEEMARLLGRQS